ncbi:MAG: cyclic-di-AMP receptor [Eubacterium sp.]|nr:cyclic-di-AMP receptor [Eubacterium sp.]
MKLIIAIISNKDTNNVTEAITQNGYSVTKISSAGQFLTDGHTTIMVGCDDDKVEKLFEILKKNLTKRIVKTPGVTSTLSGSFLNQAVDVEEYGGVAFTLDVEDFQKF